jgi:phosphoribosylformylglycinamidine cyclo-ligase
MMAAGALAPAIETHGARAATSVENVMTTRQPAEPLTYRMSGVDAEGAARGLKGLLASLQKTLPLRGEREGRALLDFGHFANVIRVGDTGIAISTDGVGSKILIAEMVERYDTLGIDLVAMNVNDLVCVGAEPLAMVDYVAVRRLEDRLLEELGTGLLAGAEAARISIPGGELAQLPDMLRGPRPDQALDLVGTAVGVVEPARLITGDEIADGDAVIGFASSGLHSNGFTLVRRVLLERAGIDLDAHIPELGRTLGEELLTPTRIYVAPILELIAGGQVHGLAHITGDGLRNLLRLHRRMSYVFPALPEPPAIYKLIAARGPVAEAEMFATFNMGIGFVAVLAEDGVAAAEAVASRHGLECFVLGRAVDDGRALLRIEDRRLCLSRDSVTEM